MNKNPKIIYLIEKGKITGWNVDYSSPYMGYIQIISTKVDKDGFSEVRPFPLWRLEMTNKTMQKKCKTKIEIGSADIYYTYEEAKKDIKRANKAEKEFQKLCKNATYGNIPKKPCKRKKK